MGWGWDTEVIIVRQQRICIFLWVVDGRVCQIIIIRHQRIYGFSSRVGVGEGIGWGGILLSFDINVCMVLFLWVYGVRVGVG